MESFSYESERSGSKNVSPDESDIENQLLAEQEGSKLQEEKEKLQKEINIIRAQFDQAIQVTKKMDILHQKNQKLAKTLRAINSENDELKRRLEISQHANEEISSKLNDEKIAASQQRQRESAEKEKEILKSRKEYEKQFEELGNRIERLSAEKEQSELHNKMLLNKIDRVMHNSNSYFGRSFSDIDSLIELLSNPPSFQQTVPVQSSLKSLENSSPVNDNTTLLNLTKRARIDKQRIKDSKKQCEMLLNELSKLRREITENDKKHNQQLQNCENKANQLKEDYVLKITDAEEACKKAEDKSNALKSDIQKLKSEIKELKAQKISSTPSSPIEITVNRPPSPPPTSKSHRNSDHSGYQEEIASLRRTNEENLQRLQESFTKNEKLSAQLKILENQNTNLEIDIENYKNKFGALQTAHNETLLEINTLRQSLHAKPDPRPIRQERKLAQRMKTQIEHLEKTIKSQNDQIHELTVEKEHQKRNEDSLQAKTTGLKNDLEDSQQKCASLQDELSDVKNQLSERPTVTIDDLIPPYAWKYSEFDQVLSQNIEKVISNPLLQPASKLNNVYKAINKHFGQLLNSKEKENNANFNEIQNLKEKMGAFITDVCILLQIKAISVGEFLGQKGSEIIVHKLSEMVQSFEDEKRKSAYFTSVLDHFTSEFGDSTDLHTQVAALKEQMDQQALKVRARSRKCAELKNMLRSLKRTAGEEIMSLKSDLNDLTSLHDEIKTKYENVSSQNSQMKRELQLLKNELGDFRVSSSEKEAAMKEEFEDELESSNEKHLSIENELKSQISQLLSSKEAAQESLDNHESTLGRLKSVINQDQKTIAEKDRLIKELKEEKEIEIAQISEKNKIEKVQLIKSYEKAVEELRKQCDAHRDDLEKVSIELSNSEKRSSQMKSNIIQLKREKMKLENEIKTLNDQIKREKQIIEAAAKTKLLAADENYGQRLQEAKSKWENEKRRMFSAAAEEFKTYFNPSESMDERSYRSFLARIKKELDTLSESDAVIRRLVGAGPRQSTDDAVAQFIMP